MRDLPVDRSFAAPGAHLCGLAWDGEALWHSDGETDLIYRMDPVSGAVRSSLPCPDVRTDLAWDGRYLWQIAGRPKRIRVLDPGTGHVVREIALGAEAEDACALEIQADRYWVGWKRTARLEERRVADDGVVTVYPASPRVAGAAVVGRVLWYTDFDRATLVGVDLRTGAATSAYHVPGNPTGLCWDGTRLWYSDYAARRLSAVRPEAIDPP